MSTLKTTTAALVAALLAACGGMESPDGALATGQVTGKLANGSSGAYAYVFGRPDIRAEVAGDGSFTLDKVPLGNGAAQIVVFDGKDRAELSGVEVKPAARTHVEKDATAMPMAATVRANARCSGGQNGSEATYTIDGLEFQRHGGGGPSGADLFPVPPGTYTIRSDLKGFKEGAQPAVQISEGELHDVEIDLAVDDSNPARGCVSAGCTGGLTCNPDDGICTSGTCTVDADCSAGFKCSKGFCEPAG